MSLGLADKHHANVLVDESAFHKSRLGVTFNFMYILLDLLVYTRATILLSVLVTDCLIFWSSYPALFLCLVS